MRAYLRGSSSAPRRSVPRGASSGDRRCHRVPARTRPGSRCSVTAPAAHGLRPHRQLPRIRAMGRRDRRRPAFRHDHLNICRPGTRCSTASGGCRRAPSAPCCGTSRLVAGRAAAAAPLATATFGREPWTSRSPWSAGSGGRSGAPCRASAGSCGRPPCPLRGVAGHAVRGVDRNPRTLPEQRARVRIRGPRAAARHPVVVRDLLQVRRVREVDHVDAAGVPALTSTSRSGWMIVMPMCAEQYSPAVLLGRTSPTWNSLRKSPVSRSEKNILPVL